jgi:HlyD family secretion protein
MKTTLTSSPIQRRQTKYRLVSSAGHLSHELGKAVENPSPLYTRLLAGGISLLLLGTLIWAAVSRVDEVAIAAGEVIPSTRVQPIRSLSGGLLRDIQVEEGDRVQAGDPLVQLDPTLSDAEFRRLTQLVQLTKENLTRLEAERIGTSQVGNDFQNQLLVSRLRESQASINRQQGLIRVTQAELRRLHTNLTHAHTKQRSLGMLVVEGAIPRLDYLDVQNQVVSLQAEIDAKEQEIYQAQQELDRLQAEQQNDTLTQINQQRQELVSLEGQLSQAKEQRDRETIAASVNGIVYNIKISEPGATIQPGEELLSIVPDGEELVLEAQVRNRDIGFVKPGVEVKIKFEAFPYQEFGILSGTVVETSPNAVNEPEIGLVYPIRIQLAQRSVQVKHEDVPLTPGMTASAEIVIRQKSILSFLVEPIMVRWDEAFSVR